MSQTTPHDLVAAVRATLAGPADPATVQYDRLGDMVCAEVERVYGKRALLLGWHVVMVAWRWLIQRGVPAAVNAGSLEIRMNDRSVWTSNPYTWLVIGSRGGPYHLVDPVFRYVSDAVAAAAGGGTRWARADLPRTLVCPYDDVTATHGLMYRVDAERTQAAYRVLVTDSQARHVVERAVAVVDDLYTGRAFRPPRTTEAHNA